MTPSLTRDGDVFVLDVGDTENRFNPEWLGAVTEHLDEVAAAPAPRALVTTATGKFFSNGLDLEWMGAHQDEVAANVAAVHELLARTLELPVITVAALQGHTFAAGAMFAIAHDQRVMRADRGFLCLPEVDINIPFTPGMGALVQARLSKAAAHEAMTTGRRYGGEDAAAAGIVDETATEDELLERAVARAAAATSKDPGTLGTIKARMYAEAIALLRDPQANALVPPA